ncbi:MAG: D-tyrosyl-tRNA(Tyr) deacylase [Chloroflexi bacterium]|nr:D-tyrosyl-tRNA(Tyr) deacylase [Chloroflexota bacterium]
MRVILQRVRRGSVTVDGQIVGAIDHGFVALVGVTHGDTRAEAELLARKTAFLRVFEDDQGKMNRSVLEVGGGVLVISQFTLYADARKGRRPSFTDAAAPDLAAPLVEYYAERLRAEGVTQIANGIFGAMMLV